MPGPHPMRAEFEALVATTHALARELARALQEIGDHVARSRKAVRESRELLARVDAQLERRSGLPGLVPSLTQLIAAAGPTRVVYRNGDDRRARTVDR
jgi:anti-sigma factor RsiW